MSDVDSGSLTGATVAITGNYASGQTCWPSPTSSASRAAGTPPPACSPQRWHGHRCGLSGRAARSATTTPATTRAHRHAVSFVVNDGMATSVAASCTVTVTPVADHLLTVDTTNDVVDCGVTTSIDALLATGVPTVSSRCAAITGQTIRPAPIPSCWRKLCADKIWQQRSFNVRGRSRRAGQPDHQRRRRVDHHGQRRQPGRVFQVVSGTP